MSEHPFERYLKEMPIFKLVMAVLISFMPFNRLRVLGYRIFLGYQILESRIGFGTVIIVDKFTSHKARLGLFNLFLGPIHVLIGTGASIGNRNTFSCGYWVLQQQYKQAHYTRTLELGKNILITSNHYFDVAGTFKLGDHSWIAGIGSQFWTHGAGVRDRNIVIGENCYLGSAVRFAPGSSVGDHVIVAMGSVVAAALPTSNALVGGVPAKVLKENYDWNSKDE